MPSRQRRPPHGACFLLSHVKQAREQTGACFSSLLCRLITKKVSAAELLPRFLAALAVAVTTLPAHKVNAAGLSFTSQSVGGAFASLVPGTRPHQNNSVVVPRAGGAPSEAIITFMVPPTEPASTLPFVVVAPQPDGRLVNVTSERFGTSAPRFATASALLVRDFNGDGQQDLFVAGGGHDTSPFPGEASGLWLGQSAGTFTDASGQLASPVAFAHSAASADFNGDGRLDIYVGTIFGQGRVSPYLLTATSSGNYELSRKLPSIVLNVEDVTFTASEAFDVDNDGHADLILATASAAKSPSLVLFNDGTGDFTKRPAKPMPAGLYGNNTLNVQVLALDVDGDGFMDLVASQTQVHPSYSGVGLQVLINDRKGGFIDRTSSYFSAAPSTTGHHLGLLGALDLDGDGRLDIHAKGVGGAIGSGHITFAWVRDAGGKFQPVDTSVTRGVLPSLFIDFNGDGLPEAVQLWRDDTTAQWKYEVFFNTTNKPIVAASSSFVDFGGQSARTTSPTRTVKITNMGTAPLAVSSISVSGPFSATHDCQSVLAGATCTLAIAFTPLAVGPFEGTLTIATNALAPTTVRVAGIGERSLVTHYYQSILRRSADGGGKSFWESEADRVSSLGASVNEAWYAMALSFYGSAEYLGFNRTPTEHVRDLYSTFFNRPADNEGLAYWTGLLAAGMPREVVLAGFMFSAEFAAFTRAIFGNTAARPEVNTVVDFYRGLLSRLPDTAGFSHWLGQFRHAQCQGPTAIYGQVESISSAYATSPEYVARARTNAQYVGDLYNAFLRRGGDLEGVKFWINQLDTGAQTREQLRRAFIASTEFSARVQAIVAGGCLKP